MNKIDEFIKSVNVGDIFWLEQSDIGLEQESMLPNYLQFYVVKKISTPRFIRKKMS